MYDEIDEDHFAAWEWQPMDFMPGGCQDVTVRYESGRMFKMCSCDYWWDVHKEGRELPTAFRYT